uniref:Uncharacterized protein n=1 Tax=Arundo donax TaxID=35708 RepID=A0A0A8YQ49_ARUDO
MILIIHILPCHTTEKKKCSCYVRKISTCS